MFRKPYRDGPLAGPLGFAHKRHSHPLVGMEGPEYYIVVSLR